MAGSHIDVPRVPVRPPRDLGPEPSLDAPFPLAGVADSLLKRQHAARLARAEARSLSPIYLEEVSARIAAERAVEENLARGRALTRHEVRRATDPARYGKDRRTVRFPRSSGCLICELLRPVLLGFGAMTAPFLVYFALVMLILL